MTHAFKPFGDHAHDRRGFLRRAAMTLTAAHLGMLGAVEAGDRESRELMALGRAGEWLNSPRLTAASLSGKVVLVDFCTYTCINWLHRSELIRQPKPIVDRQFEIEFLDAGVATLAFTFG